MAIAALHGAVQNPAYRLGDTIWPARGRSLRAGLQSSEAVVLKLRLAPRVAQPRALATPVQLFSSQTSARPPAKPKALKPIDSRATLPVRMIRSAQEILRPYFCLIGHRRRRALSRFALSGQLFNGATRCWPAPAPPRPSVMRYVPALCHAIRMNSPAWWPKSPATTPASSSSTPAGP